MLSKSYLLNPLHNHSCGCPASVADCRNAVLAHLQLVQQCCEDSGARAAKRMAERYRAAERVHARVLKAENLFWGVAG